MGLTELELNLTKEYGKGSAMLLSNTQRCLDVDFVSTGFISLDKILGGGLAKGRFFEIFGGTSTGKTTFALHVCNSVIESGGSVYYIDMEQALNGSYLMSLGIDPDKFLVSQPDDGNSALAMAEMAILQGVPLVVIDSVDSLVPRQELEGDFGDSNMGVRAKLISSACRKIVSAVNKNDTVVLWINQIRDNLSAYGGPVVPGGNALKFYTTQRVQLFNVGKIKDGEVVTGSRIKFSTVKNKVYPPFQSTELDIIFGTGFCKYSDLVDTAVEVGVVKKSTSWYSYGDERLGQGKNNVRDLLKDNKKLYDEIYAKVKDLG